MEDSIRLQHTLADRPRLRILRLLQECARELLDALNVPQSKISWHLRQLRAAELVEASRLLDTNPWRRYPPPCLPNPCL